MKQIREKIIFILKHNNSFYLSDFTKGKMEGLEIADELIGSCNACKYSFQSGSNLKCRWMMFPLDPEGHCNFYEKRISNDKSE